MQVDTKFVKDKRCTHYSFDV